MFNFKFITMNLKQSICLILSFFVFTLFCNAQQNEIGKASFCCLYTHYVQTTDKDHVAAVDSFFSILEVGESICKYGDLSTYTFQKKYLPNEMQGLTKEDCRRDEHLWVLQNYPDMGTLTVEEALHPSFFSYKESTDTLHWTILSGDSVILDYKCHHARLYYGGREWMVWYTDEIPASTGPWKLIGLPGLVLFAQDKTGTHTFHARSIFNVENQIITESNNSDYKIQKTKRDSFIKTRNKIKYDPQWMRLPWYNDRTNVNMAILNAKDRKRLGITPFISVNGIKYPCRERSDGMLEYIHNYYQPLEWY